MRPSPALRLELLAVLVLVAAAQASAQVVVAIEANPGIAKPGEQLEIRVTVSNQGAGAVAGVSLNLVVPAELDPFLNSVPTPAFSGCSQVVNNSLCEPGETISWNLGTINARQSVTTSLTPIVAAGAIGPILFNPTASTGGSASATVTVNAARTLDVSVHEGGDPVAAGDDLVYTLHFGNASPSNTAPGALLSFPVPAGTTFASASDGGILNAGNVEWSLGTLQPSQSGTRTVRVTTNAGLVRGAFLLASASLSDTSPQTAQAREVTEVDGLEALEVAMVLGPDPAAPGEQLEIALTLTNTSGSALTGVSLLLRWPQQINPFLLARGIAVSSGCTQVVNNSTCSAGEFAIWNLGTLEAGQSVTVSYSADLASASSGTVVDFEATALNTGADDRAEVGRAVAVRTTHRLELSVHAAADPIAAGDDLVYSLVFGNTSMTTGAPNALLRLPVPAGTTFVSASDGGVLNAGNVEWSLGTIAPGESGVRTVTLDTNAGLVRGALVRAEARLSDTSSPAQLARARAATEIDGLDPLRVAMEIGQDPVPAGEQLEIALTVTNTGVSALTGVSLVLRWPQQTDPLLIGQGINVSSGCTQVFNNGSCEAGEFAIWTIGTLNAGQSTTVSYSADLAATSDGAVVDFEAIASDTGSDSRATAGRAISVDSARQLRVGLHEAVDPVGAGDNVVYTLSYGNTSSNTTAPGAVLRFAVPAGAAFVTASGGGSLIGNNVEWSLGILTPLALGTRTVTVHADPGLVRGALLRADASLADTASPAQRARANAVTEVDGSEALETAITVSNAVPAPGYKVDVTVTNTDVASHMGVWLYIRVPRDAQSFALASVTGATGGCLQIVASFQCEAGEFIIANLGTMTAGQSATVSIPKVVIDLPSGGHGGLYQIDAFAVGTGTDERAVDKVVPEPGVAASLLAGIALLAALQRRR